MGHHRILNTATTRNKSRQVDDFPDLEHTNRPTGPARETDSRLNGQFGHCAARFFTPLQGHLRGHLLGPPKDPFVDLITIHLQDQNHLQASQTQNGSEPPNQATLKEMPFSGWPHTRTWSVPSGAH